MRDCPRYKLKMREDVDRMAAVKNCRASLSANQDGGEGSRVLFVVQCDVLLCDE